MHSPSPNLLTIPTQIRSNSCFDSPCSHDVHLLVTWQEADLEVRLLGPVQGDFISEGQVQVKRKGRWGFICPTSWGHNEARVVCGQLGFPDAQRRVPYEEQTEDQNVTYWMDAVQCTGVESALVSCGHKGWGPHTCPGNRVVRVTCVRFQVSQVC